MAKAGSSPRQSADLAARCAEDGLLPGPSPPLSRSGEPSQGPESYWSRGALGGGERMKSYARRHSAGKGLAAEEDEDFAEGQRWV